MSVTTPEIRPLDGFARSTDFEILSRGLAIQSSMTDNPRFPNPPVDLPALKEVLRDVRSRKVRVVSVETKQASPRARNSGSVRRR